MILLLASAIIVFLLDQATKRIVENRFSHRPLEVGNVLRVRHYLSRRPRYASLPLRLIMIAAWIAAAISAAILFTGGGPLSTHSALMGAGAALGGAAGNLLDILRSESVRDFIDLGWWPAFNIADVAIIAGILTALTPR
jgi:signal peptidase II